MNEKEYLGDSVYAEFDGDGIILTTENGLPEQRNTIYLDMATIAALTRFVEMIAEKP